MVHKGSGIEFQLAVQFSVCCLLRLVLVLVLLLLFFFFLFFPSLVLLFFFIAIFSCRSVLSFLSVSVVAVCYGCSILLRILVAYLLIYRYTDTDPQILSVSSFVSNICQLQILQLILAPSWCSSTGDTFPSYHQSSVAFSLCRGLPLSSTSGDAVGRVID